MKLKTQRTYEIPVELQRTYMTEVRQAKEKLERALLDLGIKPESEFFFILEDAK